MNVNANTPCRLTRGLNRSCKTFEFTNIARSMHSRTLVALFASSRKCISLYRLPCVCLVKRLNSRTLLGVRTPERLLSFSLLVVSVLAYIDRRVFALLA